MDLVSAKVEAATASKGGKKVFINVDDEGECTLGKFDPKSSTVCYSNGSQIPMPKPDDVVMEEKPVKSAKVKSIKTEKKVETKKKPAKKVAKKKVAKKATAARTAVPSAQVKALLANGGKKETLTITQALKKAKDGINIYRATNGSPFGKYYLDKIANKERKMELITRK